MFLPAMAFCCFAVLPLVMALPEQSQSSGNPSRQRPRRRPPAKEDQEPEIKGQTQLSVDVGLVNLEVGVYNKKKNPIVGLGPQHFEIYEDGVRQQIKNFTPIEAPITVVMLIEYSRQVEYLIRDIWTASYGFIRTLRDDDWCAIIGYDIRPTIVADFTQDKGKLFQAMRRFNFPAFSESNLSDALYDTLDRLTEVEGRAAVLLISTGLDTFSKITYSKVLKKAKSSDAPIYTISMGQTLRILMDARGYLSGTQRIELLQSDNRLRSFAKLSGGLSFEPRFVTQYPSIFQTISAFLRHKYSIGYVSSNLKQDGKYRKIRIKVKADANGDGKPDKLTVSHRQGYYAPKG